MSRVRLSCGITFIVAGLLHFIMPKPYISIMPPYLPAHKELVLLSGVAEAGGGVLILIPGLEKPARWFMIATLIAIFPANVHVAMNPDQIKGLPEQIPHWTLWARLPFQAAFIWWVLRATQKRPVSQPQP
jgi:uncharacterized membrane protein